MAAARGTSVTEPNHAVTGRQEKEPRRPSLALAAVCLGFFMILLDGSALNIALPVIEADIHGSMATLQWVLLWTGGLVSLIGSIVLLGLSGPATWPLFAIGTGLVGLGCGIFSPSLNAAAMLSIEPAYAGLGSGVLNTARQVGMAMGIALLGSLIAMHNALLGLRLSLVLVSLCFLAVILLSIAYVPRKETAG